MELSRLKVLVDVLILPTFQGTQIVPEPEGFPSTKRFAAQPSGKPNNFLVVKKKLSDQKPDRILLSRPQTFSRVEIEQIDRLIGLCIEYEDSVGSFESHRGVIFNTIVSQTASKESPELLLRVLTFFEYIQSRTYEGRRIPFSIVVSGSSWPVAKAGVQFESCLDQDFFLVLSNGVDSTIVLDGAGGVTDYAPITELEKRLSGTRFLHIQPSRGYYPQVYRDIASITVYGFVAVVSTQGGDTLIFQAGHLAFARRRGEWTFFHHEKIISMMTLSVPNRWSEGTRTAIYETAIDASFSHSGGLIILLRRDAEVFIDELVYEADLLDNTGSEKSRTVFFRQFSGREFATVDRRLRKEIVGIDGAVVLNHSGRFLAIGAIIKSPESSDSGARKAAARRAATYGLAVKISTDGLISGYGLPPTGEVAEIFQFG